MALAKLAASQKVMNTVFITYGVLTAVIFFGGLAYALSHVSTRRRRSTAVTCSSRTSPPAAPVRHRPALPGRCRDAVQHGRRVPLGQEERHAYDLLGLDRLVVIYLLTTIGTMLVLPTAKINSVTGVIDNLGTSLPSGVMEVCAVVLAVIVFTALATYAIAYSRLIFVSGLERHLPRIFTHLNPRTRNPVTAILIQGAFSSVLIIGLFSQSSLANVTIYLTGGLSVIWLASGLFFFIPPLIARVKYADRYANEDFWRIPGGKPGSGSPASSHSQHDRRHLLLLRRIVAPDVPNDTWMIWLGSIVAGTLVVMVWSSSSGAAPPRS